MTQRDKIVRAMVFVIVLILPVCGSVGPFADIAVAKQTETAPQKAPSETLPPPSHTHIPEGLNGTNGGPSNNKDGDKDDAAKQEKENNTARAKLLALLLLMFEGHRGAAP